MAAPTIDEMHQALGRFLTECGRVEFTMLLFVDFISEAPIEHLFEEYSPLTFGDKIKWRNSLRIGRLWTSVYVA